VTTNTVSAMAHLLLVTLAMMAAIARPLTAVSPLKPAPLHSLREPTESTSHAMMAIYALTTTSVYQRLMGRDRVQGITRKWHPV
jgi:hypothetical protein